MQDYVLGSRQNSTFVTYKDSFIKNCFVLCIRFLFSISRVNEYKKTNKKTRNKGDRGTLHPNGSHAGSGDSKNRHCQDI